MDDELVALAAVVLLFGGGTLFLLALSPIGKALAARIRGATAPDDGEVRESLQAIQSELEDLRALRRDVAELAERVDFAERLLARRREPERLGPGT